MSAPEGWKLVPVEPTEEMLEALGTYMVEGKWQAMLAAAPTPPAQEPISMEPVGRVTGNSLARQGGQYPCVMWKDALGLPITTLLYSAEQLANAVREATEFSVATIKECTETIIEQEQQLAALQAMLSAYDKWLTGGVYFTNDEYKLEVVKTNELQSKLAQAEKDKEELVEALKFYADGYHFVLHEPLSWDTVSGEPENFQEDDANTATVEDGSLAKQAIAKHEVKK